VKRRTPTWLVACARALLSIAAGSVIVFGVLLELDIYRDPTWVPIALAIVVAIGSVITNFRGTLHAATESRREGVRQRIQKASIGAAAVVHGITGLDMLTIGVSVFRARRRPALKCALWPFFMKVHHLERVERFRLTDIPQPSKVKWMAGKGAIGKCLETRRRVHKNWSPIVLRLQDHDVLTVDEYRQIPEADRDGFTYDEFVGIMDKYAEVLALPIMSAGGGEIVGVIAIDRPFDPERVTPLLNNLKVRDAVETAAATISADVASAPILDR
jgi:hypothetical protein